MVDCSHGNSGKDHARQPVVNEAIARQIEEGGSKIFGVMIEAFLVEGRQDYSPDGGMVNGQSITDACVNLATCELMLERLAQARAKVSA
jgi:3-deoxy-7-phosphoheptulonate synthase